MEAFFLPADAGRTGQRFCLLHAPSATAPASAIVYVHPFAEEMNKSRRMAALQSRAFAAAGHAVLQIDLLGCGDSSGDFGDARWADWVQDVAQAAGWMRNRFPGATLWLWGLRAGCLLASEAASLMDDDVNFLFWQAPSSGKPLLQQFLRLKTAGDMLDGKASNGMDALKRSLAADESIEIAGYTLSPSVARGLEQATLRPPRRPASLVWLEVSAREEREMSPASSGPLARWTEAGMEVRSDVLPGSAFWQTTEIAEAPALIDASLRAIDARVAAAVS